MENTSGNKGRHYNFSWEEITKLKELLEKYSIILSKKTDHASTKQKYEAWHKLTNEFNSMNDIFRTKKQLFFKFNNMKKNARKELSQEKREGPPPPRLSDTTKWLCSIMGESMVGLPSTHDPDLTQEPVNRKRKLIFKPYEKRKNIGLMAHEKELHLKKRGAREQRLLDFAEEEHRKNMEHIKQLQTMEVDFKRKLNELMLKKAAVELEIEEEKLKKLKNENKD